MTAEDPDELVVVSVRVPRHVRDAAHARAQRLGTGSLTEKLRKAVEEYAARP